MFLFAVCQPGAERALKSFASRAAVPGGLRLAFSKPGFVTFKSDAPVALAAHHPLDDCPFARSWGQSIGEATGISAIAQSVGALEPARVHVFPMGAGAFAELDPAALDAANSLASALRATFPKLEIVAPGAHAIAQSGERVADVAVTTPESAWVGLHVHTPDRTPYPGGLIPISLPGDAPSRAYLKLEEALHRFALPLRAGDLAIELGSAPGGASWALCQRGLRVLGVDPGDMDPRVLASPLFEHRKVPAGALQRSDLPRGARWLLVDMNLAPRVSLRYAERVAGPLRKSLIGAVVTLKINDDAAEQALPQLIERVRALADFDWVRATQLPSNRSEVCVVARRLEPKKGL
ncbi:MAG: SAM-dependent methyltransferase [Polyangiaceae bacterium]